MTPLTEADLLAYVEEESDFQFEMQVVQACSTLFSETEHGGYYLEANTGKKRQFDIRVRHFGNDASLCLAIECKNLHPSHPLLVSCVPRTAEESFHELIVYPNLGAMPTTRRLKAHASMFWPNAMVGKAMAHVSKVIVTEDKRSEPRAEFSGKDTEVYEKWAQAVSSAHGLVQRVLDLHNGLRVHAVIPMLVIPDGSLWKVDYRQDGQRESNPVRVERCDYFLGTEIVNQHLTYAVSHLMILTLAGFRKFVEDLILPVSPLQGTWQKLFPWQHLGRMVSPQ